MSYRYELNDKKFMLYHMVGSTETDWGMKSTIIKNNNKAVPLNYIKHGHVYEKLFTCRPDYPTDVVFIQVSMPGHAFQTYEAETHCIAITANAYLRLLEFVRNDLKKVLGKLDHDTTLLTQKKDCVYITPTICSDSIENMVFEHPLDGFGEDQLHLIIRRNVATKETGYMLKYTDDNLGQMGLPIKTVLSICEDRTMLMKLLNYNYKDKYAKKRTR